MVLNKEAINKKRALHLLWGSIGPMRAKYILFLLVILTNAVVGLAPPQLYRLFFQSIENDSFGIFNKLVIFGVLIAVCTFFATCLSIYAQEWFRCEIEGSLRKEVLSALSLTSLQQLEKVNRGEWIACIRDCRRQRRSVDEDNCVSTPVMDTIGDFAALDKMSAARRPRKCQDCAGPTVSAITAWRWPSGSSDAPTVLSRAVWCSISAFS